MEWNETPENGGAATRARVTYAAGFPHPIKGDILYHSLGVKKPLSRRTFHSSVLCSSHISIRSVLPPVPVPDRSDPVCGSFAAGGPLSAFHAPGYTNIPPDCAERSEGPSRGRNRHSSLRRLPGVPPGTSQKPFQVLLGPGFIAHQPCQVRPESSPARRPCRYRRSSGGRRTRPSG